MRIIVTGGAGYIGGITTKHLLDKGYDVLVYDSLIKGNRNSVDPRAKFVKGNLNNKELLNNVFKNFKPEAVIHFAAFIEAGESMDQPEKFFGNNVVNGLRLLDTMKKNGVKKIVYSSSAGVYAASNKILKENSSKEPANPYGETKLIFEKILKWYDQIYGIKHIALRYFNATGCDGDLGERHDPETHLIPLVIFAALGKRENIKIFGKDYKTKDGTCIRDYVDVRDLARAHLLALGSLTKNSESKAYNVGTGKGLSVKEIIDSVKKITGNDFSVIEEDRRQGDPAILVADSTKIKKELGWKPEVNFKEGLKENIEFFKRTIKR